LKTGRTLFLFAFIISWFVLPAQKAEFKKRVVEGNFLLLEENYMKALSEFQKAYVFDSLNSNLNYKIGLCYFKHPTQKHLAETYLEKAVKNISKLYDEEDPLMKTAPPIALFYYGQALHLDYKFDEALKMYEEYKTYLNPKRFKSELELVEHHIQMSHNAHDRVSSPASVQITNLGDSVNSQFAEVSPVLSGDERMLIFTYAGPLSTGASYGMRTPEDGFFEDIFVSYKNKDGTWTTPDTLPGNVNTGGHEGAVGLSADGQTLLIYRDDLGDGNLYYSIWNGTEWEMPLKYGPEINSTAWEPSACLSPDGNAIFFVSNRPGGFGGRDIYQCKKLPGGAWGKAQNLGPKINTKYDEESPFLHPNGMDFFFSSQGHTSMGGFDIFFSMIDSAGGFGEPIALQYPINTTDDDEFYVSSPDNKRAYYASSHEDRSGFGEQDIYMISVSHPGEEEESRLVVFSGKVIPDSGKTLPPGITIQVSYKKSGDAQGLYKPQLNGNFTVVLAPEDVYLFSYKLNGVEFFNEEVNVPGGLSYQEIEREVPLNPVVVHNVQDPVVKNTGSSISISITVIDLKNFVPEPDAQVTLEENGTVQKFKTDQSGKMRDIPLEAGKTYRLNATFDGFSGETMEISTKGMVGHRKLEKTIYVFTSKETYNVDSLVEGKFIHYFEFNQTDIEHFRNYPQFLSKVDSAIARKGSVTIVINGCASHIPTKAPGGLVGLAKARSETLVAKLKEHLTSIGVDLSKVSFELNQTVGGPPYKPDYRHNIRKYEKFQFVEASVK
jgi:hypothetical protein